MKTIRIRVWAVTALWLAAGLSQPLLAANKIWTGLGANALWSTPANWTPAGAPTTGDSVIFPGGAPRAVNTNDLVGLSLSSLDLTGATGGYQLYGNTVFLTSAGQGLTTLHTIGNHSIFLNLSLSTAVTTGPQAWQLSLVGAGTVNFYGNLQLSTRSLSVSNTAAVTFWGVVQGSGNLTNTGPGAFTLAGNAGNTLSGTVAVNGTTNVFFVKTSGAAAPGGLEVAGTGLVTLQSDDQIEGDVVLRGQSELDLNDHDDAIGALTLVDSDVRTGAGLLTLGGDVNVGGTYTNNLVHNHDLRGRLSLGSSTRVIRCENGALLRIYATISGAHTGVGLTKEGSGFLALYGANTYGGVTRLNDGDTSAFHPSSFGSTINGTILGFTSLHLYDISIGAEPLTADGGLGGSFLFAYGTAAWDGDLTLISTLHAGAILAGELNLNGAISGSGDLQVNQNARGVVRLNGAAANTFTGTTEVGMGELILNKTTGPAVPASLIVGTSGGTNEPVVRLVQDQQITGDVTLYNRASLMLQNHDDSIGSLTVEAAAITTGTGTLTVGGGIEVLPMRLEGLITPSDIAGKLSFGTTTCPVNCVSNAAALWINAAATSASTGAGLRKEGPGALHLAGTNTYLGTTVVREGRLHVHSDQALGSTLSGTTIGTNAILLLYDVAIGAEALTFQAGPGVATLLASGTASWEGPMTFTSGAEILSESGELNLNGPLSGPGGVVLNRSASGDLRFNGTSANTFSGDATLLNGRLFLNKPPGVNALGGPLIVGEAGVSNSALARLLADDQIAGPVTLYPEAALYLNDHNETLPALTLQAAKVFSGTGLLTFSGGLTNLLDPRPGGSASHIYGRVSVGTGTRPLQCNQGVLYFDAEVSGQAIIQKLGVGVLRFETNNTFTGRFEVLAGAAVAAANSALGTTQGGVFVATNCILSLDHAAVGEEPITLQGDASGTAQLEVEGDASLAGTLIVNRAGRISCFNAGDRLALLGRLNGPGDLQINTSTSQGTITFAGTNDNPISGDLTLLGGTLVLSNTRPGAVVIPGQLQVNQPGSTNATTLRWERNLQFGPGGTLILEDNAVCNLNGHREEMQRLDLRAPVAITALGGELKVADRLLVSDTRGTPASMDGELTFPAGAHVVDIGSNSLLNVTANITGAGGLTKTGLGVLSLFASNSFGGDLVLSNGFVFANHARALGSTAGETFVRGTSTLELWGGYSFPERINLQSAGQPGFGALYSGGGSNTLTAFLSLGVAPPAGIRVNQTSDVLNLAGDTAGAASLTKIGAGVLELSGAGPSSSGEIFVQEGVLRVSGSNQIGDNTAVNVATDATFRLVGTGGAETIGSLAGAGTVQLGGNRLTLGGDGRDTTFSGVITGTQAGDAGLTKVGAGELVLSADNTYPGDTLVTDGKLTVTGDSRTTDVIVSGSGRLGGTGRVGNVNLNAGGTLAPGASPGRLTVSNLVCAAGSTLRMEVEGPTVATEFDQVDVNGQFSPGGNCDLKVVLNGYEPPEGTSFNLVRNDSTDGIAGTFLGLPEGAQLTVDDTTFAVSYLGGTGNDVTLTVTNPPVISSVRLRIEPVDDGAKVRLRWLTNAVGFLLERSGEVPSTNWLATTNSLSIEGRYHVLTNAANADARFWRLRKP